MLNPAWDLVDDICQGAGICLPKKNVALFGHAAQLLVNHLDPVEAWCEAWLGWGCLGFAFSLRVCLLAFHVIIGEALLEFQRKTIGNY